MNKREFLHSVGLSLATLPFSASLSHAAEATFFREHLFQRVETPTQDRLYDTIIVGGSYGGLSAALSLGRCLRSVLVVDSGKPRNYSVEHINNLFGNDGIQPTDLRKNVKSQLEKYKLFLQFLNASVTTVSGKDMDFSVTTSEGMNARAKKLIFATGSSDTLPDIQGIREQWGKNVHHCPYCHGFESRKGKTILISNGPKGFAMLPSLRHWCEDITVCTNEVSPVPEQVVEYLKKENIALKTEKVSALLTKKDGSLKEMVLANGTTLPCDHVYLYTKPDYATALPLQLNCTLGKSKNVETNDFMLTSVPGVYAIGDLSSKSMGQVIWAAHSGFMAAVDINNTLISASMK
jgi:thioredoxin reductase